MKSLDEMTEPELKVIMTKASDAVRDALPPGTGFVILATPFGGPGIAQYASNVQRVDAAKWMTETVERWAFGDFVPRVGK